MHIELRTLGAGFAATSSLFGEIIVLLAKTGVAFGVITFGVMVSLRVTIGSFLGSTTGFVTAGEARGDLTSTFGFLSGISGVCGTTEKIKKNY